MGKLIEKRNGVNIFEYEAPKYRGVNNVNAVTSEGMVFRLYNWLKDNGHEEDFDAVYENTSGIRNGNEIHIHDDYKFDWDDDDLYISYLYYHNGNVWAVLINKTTDTWYGEFEL